eukprot:g33031.t1
MAMCMDDENSEYLQFTRKGNARAGQGRPTGEHHRKPDARNSFVHVELETLIGLDRVMGNIARCADSASRIKLRRTHRGFGGSPRTHLPRAQAREKKKGSSKERRRVILMLGNSCLVAAVATQAEKGHWVQEEPGLVDVTGEEQGQEHRYHISPTTETKRAGGSFEGKRGKKNQEEKMGAAMDTNPHVSGIRQLQQWDCRVCSEAPGLVSTMISHSRRPGCTGVSNPEPLEGTRMQM